MIQRPDSERRLFIRDFGRGVLGITIGGTVLAACSGEAETATTLAAGTSAASTSEATTIQASTTTAATNTAATTTEPSPATTSAVEIASGFSVHRANLGFVSAYVLVRGTEAVVVDTAQGGAANDIEAALAEAGLTWGSVGSVILTHGHRDHIGALASVAERASEASIGAGASDVGAITVPGRTVDSLVDGQMVLGTRIVATPGHTEGHVCVWDAQTRVLIAGDALIGAGTPYPSTGGIGGSIPEFTADAAAANDSVRKLAALEPDTIWFGHGDPLIGDASDALNALVDTL